MAEGRRKLLSPGNVVFASLAAMSGAFVFANNLPLGLSRAGISQGLVIGLGMGLAALAIVSALLHAVLTRSKAPAPKQTFSLGPDSGVQPPSLLALALLSLAMLLVGGFVAVETLKAGGLGLPVAFTSPSFLLLLPLLLPGVYLMGQRSLSGLDAIRRHIALGLRLSVVTLLVLALAETQWRDLSDTVEVIFVVDHSRSVPESETNRALDVVNHAQEVMDGRRDLGRVVAFGRDAYIERKLRPGGARLERFQSELQRDYTNLEVALERALESFSDPNVRGRVVLVTDGNENVGDISAAVARARAQQVPVDVLPLEYSYGDEILVEKVVLPHESKVGEPFMARVVIHAVGETPARVHLWLEGNQIESRDVVLQPGPNVELFQLDLVDPGFFRVEAVVETLEGGQDQLFQNNTAHGFVFARGQSTVLLVYDGDADAGGAESRDLLAALRAEDIRVTPDAAVNFPLESMALQSYDAVILDNVSRASLSERQQAAIEQAVGDMGLGLIMIGGDRSFGAGEWRGSPVEDALPVEMEIKQEEVIPDGCLVMIVHSSEMAEGNAMAVKVCKKAVDGLSAKDTVGVIVYGGNSGGEEWVVPPTPAENKPAIKRAIHNMSVGDMPDFDAVFRLALQGLSNVDAAVKHMIVLSDGDPSPPAPGLLRQCIDNRITVSTICYFSHGGSQGPETQLMQRIANSTGGKYYYLQSADDLPRIFIKESQRVARSLIVNQTFVPEITGRSPLMAGIDSVPQLTGYVLTEAKPRADIPMVSPEGAPILAHWQYGVGKSVAFTSDARPRWAASWVQWGGYQSFWAQTVRWASKDVQESVFNVSTGVRGDRGQIILDAVNANGDVVDGLTVNARVATPDGEHTMDVRLTQRGAGRYEGDFPVSEVGTYSVSLLTTNEDGQRSHSITTGLVSPYSDEFKRLRSNRPFLEQLAQQGDGRVLSVDAILAGEVDLWDRDQLSKKVALVEKWPLVLGIALFLFLIDVAVRRVAIDYDKLWARAKAAVTRTPVPEASTMDRLRQRKQAVRSREETMTNTAAKFEADVNADHGPVEIAGASNLAEGQVKATPKARTRPGAGPRDGDEDDGIYTNRLLAAKRRARRDLGSQDEENES